MLRGAAISTWIGIAGMQAISGQLDVMGDDRIVLVPLPGHTLGLDGRAGRARLCFGAGFGRQLAPGSLFSYQ